MTDPGQDMSTPGTPVESEDRPPPEAQRQPDPTPRAIGAGRGVGPAWLRGVLALPAFTVVGLVAAAPVILASGAMPPSDAVLLGATGCAAAACIGFVLAAWPLLCGAPLRALGLTGPSRRAALRVGAGTLAGTIIMAVIVGIGCLAGAWQLGPAVPRPLELVGATAVLLVASLWEEMGFRGVILQELGRKRLAIGVCFSSLAFALVHLGNPGALEGAAARVLVPLNTLLAALVLAAAFLVARDLWWPWGLHFGWNWAQSCVFGLPVSGVEMPSMLRGTPSDAPAWLTGSRFGPEASVIATAVEAASLAALLVALRRRRPVLPVVAFDRAARHPADSPIAAAQR